MPFRIPPTEIVRLAAAEYLRSFWWFVVVTPIFGLAAVVFGEGALRAVGTFAVLWPLSIPARAVFATAKLRRLFRGEVVFRETPEAYLWSPVAGGPGLRVRRGIVRDVVRRGPYLLVRTRRLGFAPVLAEAWPEGTPPA